MMYIRLTGSSDIHVRFIRRSYRIRGMVVRVIMNMVINSTDWVMIIKIDIVGDKDFCSKRMVEIRETNMIFRYSAIKMNANINLEYSVLNPDTSSLSPSAKSKGARLVSANRQMNHT